MPEEQSLHLMVISQMSHEQVVARIGEFRANRNHTIAMRNKVENLYRYAKIHDDILPDITQAQIVEDDPDYRIIADRLTDTIRFMSKEIAKLTDRLKQMNS